VRAAVEGAARKVAQAGEAGPGARREGSDREDEQCRGERTADPETPAPGG